MRDLAANNLLGDYVIPIIEPVKLSPTLIKTISEYVRVKHPLAVIRNPAVGSFMKDWKDVKEGTKEETYKNEFLGLYNEDEIVKSLIMQKNIASLLTYLEKKGVKKTDLLVKIP